VYTFNVSPNRYHHFVSLLQDPSVPFDKTGYGNAEAFAIVERITYPHLPLPKGMQGDAAESMESLMNAIAAPKHSNNGSNTGNSSKSSSDAGKPLARKDSIRMLNGEVSNYTAIHMSYICVMRLDLFTLLIHTSYHSAHCVIFILCTKVYVLVECMN
jgi:hypothetical protein